METRTSLGSSPWGEDCAQVGQPGYEERAVKECEAYKAQLAQIYLTRFGTPLPIGAKLVVQECPHDFGTYYEVFGVYEEEDEDAQRALMWLDHLAPEEWSPEARVSLGLI